MMMRPMQKKNDEADFVNETLVDPRQPFEKPVNVSAEMPIWK